MLTLLVTVLATAYFVVPELLTRFIVSFYFVRKATTGTRSEELLRAASWLGSYAAASWTEAQSAARFAVESHMLAAK